MGTAVAGVTAASDVESVAGVFGQPQIFVKRDCFSPAPRQQRDKPGTTDPFCLMLAGQ
jgi:hypothetical protein